MPVTSDLPADLKDVPFTTATARRHGVGRGVLAGRRCRQLFRGVWISADVPITFRVLLSAALLALPRQVVVSHTSAMRLYGLEPRTGRHRRLEFSTTRSHVTRHLGIVLHRRQRRISTIELDGFTVTGPERTFVDCAGRLTFVELVQLGDWLIHTGRTSFDALTAYALDRHLHGVRRARRAVAYVRANVESPMETIIRLMLVFARLPEPACNVVLLDAEGRFLGRGDLVLDRWKVLIEYDGWHHERSAAQRRQDIRRRERIEASGWIVIVITSGDLRHASEIPWRVHRAIAARGYSGRSPRMNVMWHQWFTF
jgi:hypothetical protein